MAQYKIVAIGYRCSDSTEPVQMPFTESLAVKQADTQHTEVMGKIELRAQAPGPFITDSNRNDRSSNSGVEPTAAQMSENSNPKRIHRWLSSKKNLRIQ